ncbi:MAG: MOFRL family protein, partial [Leptospirales bacterium]
ELGLSLGLSLGQIPAVVGCLATDGLDGNSGLSGILFHTSSLQKEPVRKRVRLSLKKHDTSLFVQTEGFMLKYGPTGTNLNDLVWVYLPQSVQEG